MTASGMVGLVGMGIGGVAALAGITVAAPVLTGIFLASLAAGAVGAWIGADYGA